MSIEPIVNTVIDLIKDNLVAKTNVVSNVSTGATTINVENSFHFMANQEILLIDYGYNVQGDPHHDVFEYAKIKLVNNTSTITLTKPIIGNWTVTRGSFVQKTIGHSPLYTDQVYYGDREVIPTDMMAVTVEPVSMSNEWIYIQGGLSEEYKLSIKVYGKDIKFEEGRRILDRYSDNVVELLNRNIHIGVEEYSTPLLANVAAGSTTIVIEDTPENQEHIVPSILIAPMMKTLTQVYQLQDNQGVSFWFGITNIVVGAGLMTITIDKAPSQSVAVGEYAVLKRFGAYLYDSRADAATYGVVSKGSALLRASEINWFGKVVNEFSFPQPALNLRGFKKKIPLEGIGNTVIDENLIVD